MQKLNNQSLPINLWHNQRLVVRIIVSLIDYQNNRLLQPYWLQCQSTINMMIKNKHLVLSNDLNRPTVLLDRIELD